MASTSISKTPIEDAIRAKVSLPSVLPSKDMMKPYPSKITEAIHPFVLEIRNDSALHSHHQAMVGSTSTETHFSINIVSDAFEAKSSPARHRMIYGLLKEELDRPGGVHALQLRTKTPLENAKSQSS